MSSKVGKAIQQIVCLPDWDCLTPQNCSAIWSLNAHKNALLFGLKTLIFKNISLKFIFHSSSIFVLLCKIFFRQLTDHGMYMVRANFSRFPLSYVTKSTISETLTKIICISNNQGL